MNSLPLWATVLIFLGAAVAVWIAGIFLSAQTDVLATRLHLGSALGGVILLAIATNLPEIAITVSAAASGNIGVAVGNILGGIAIQTVVLVALDAFGRRGGPPLTYRAASLVLVIEGLLVVAVLMVVIAGTQLPAGLIAFRVAPGGVLIFVLWLVGLFLINRAHTALPWHESGQAPGGQPEPQGHSQHKTEKKATEKKVSTAKAATIFGTAALVTLIGGVLLERSGDAIAGDIGLSGVLFGATILAAATSLPELSTGLQSVRQGDDQLAVSDIFGGNAFLPVLFLLATLVPAKRCCRRPRPPTSTSPRLGCCSPWSTSPGCCSGPPDAYGEWGSTPWPYCCSTCWGWSDCSPSRPQARQRGPYPRRCSTSWPR